tara:strand:- start:4085 stop:5494 length:1410 start_codon:yes stop_codon:yes gene_type:complete
MSQLTSASKRYSLYCQEHTEEFNNELRRGANTALGWPARTAALLMLVSTIITYSVVLSRENPNAVYVLFSYSIPISIAVLYPFLTTIFSQIEKYSVQFLDLLCFSGIIGFTITLFLIFEGASTEEESQNLFLPLQGQVAFVLAITSAFSFHRNYYVTLARNFVFAFLAGIFLFMINEQFFVLNILPLFEGYLFGTLLNWVFYDGVRTRFYLKSTDADTRQHLYNQLSKLVYPHQLERIKLGDELENTMPLKEGKAIINVFDVQRSGEIRHEKTQEFFMGIFQSFLQVCMKGYEHNPLRSRAFRLKETGDGFISAVGYPFLPIDSRSLADSAVSTALTMFEAFNLEVKKFNYSRPIKGAMGLAYNSVQGTFQSGGIRSYDLFGDALIQAAKYEELRKQPVLWEIFCEHAREQGLVDFNILIVQEFIYNSLSPSYRDLFTEIDLADERLVKRGFHLMYDNEAKYIYFHLLE